jgi:hypothetical protein
MYLLQCNKPDCRTQYIGETLRKIQDRLREHLRDVNKASDTLVAQHFFKKGHTCNPANISVQILQVIHLAPTQPSTTMYRRQQERQWIHQMRIMYPTGINIKEYKM